MQVADLYDRHGVSTTRWYRNKLLFYACLYSINYRSRRQQWGCILSYLCIIYVCSYIYISANKSFPIVSNDRTNRARDIYFRVIMYLFVLCKSRSVRVCRTMNDIIDRRVWNCWVSSLLCFPLIRSRPERKLYFNPSFNPSNNYQDCLLCDKSQIKIGKSSMRCDELINRFLK